MTNGEKLVKTFPNCKVKFDEYEYMNCLKSYSVIPVIFDDFYEVEFLGGWWNAEYQEPTTERGQKTNKSAMMQEIYMQGVNMAGEYQGCWVRFKEIEKIVDKYVR